MSAARLLKQARAAGLSLQVSPTGKLACRGPVETLERLKPALAEHRDDLLAELRAESAYDPKRLRREADRRNADAMRSHLTDASAPAVARPPSPGRTKRVERCGAA